MKSWQDATNEERRIYEAIKILFSKHFYLLETLFNHQEPRLVSSSEVILDQIKGFSTGEEVLIQVGIDLWNCEGGAQLSEILRHLDEKKLSNFILTLQFLHKKSIVGTERQTTIKNGE